MADYQEFLDGIDRKAYHEGEWQWQEDGYTVTRTYNYSAPGCHDGCGLLLYVKDGKLERVEGDPLDPFANGKLCMRCINLPEIVNHPDRLKYPMKRAREDRGKDKWERITWEEAVDIIEAEVKKIDDAGLDRASILGVHGTGRNVNWQLPFIAGAVFGSPNSGTFGFSGQPCYMPRVCGTAAPMGDFFIVDASMGHPDRYANKEWVRPDVVVMWACQAEKSNADGYLGHWLVQCVQLGTKLITIDPVLTWWGARSEYWLQIRPATDTALALAWMNVIIEEDLWDHEFVENWCAYFNQLAKHVKQFTPEWAAGVCGVTAEEIIGSARMFANAERAGVQWGLPFDTQISSTHAVLSVLDLIAITGNIDKPGTNLIVRNAFEINPGYALSSLYCRQELLEKKLTIKQLNPEFTPFIGACDSEAIQNAIENPELNHIPYPIKMAFGVGVNNIACMAMDTNRFYKSMESVDFFVIFDYCMTPTAMCAADLVLPAKMSCERDAMRVWWTPLRAMKGVTDYYEAKSEEELIVLLGNRLRPELFNDRWPDVDSFLQDYLETGFAKIDPVTGKGIMPPGRNKVGFIEVDDIHSHYYHKHDGDVSFKKLVEMGGHEYDEWNDTYYKYEKGMLRPDGSLGFMTASGRIELIPPTYQVWGIPPKPCHTDTIALEKYENDPEYRKEYPFILITGARSYEYFHSEGRQQPTLREFHPEPLVQISVETAKEYDLKDGDMIWMENEYGRFMQKVAINSTIENNILSCEHGWWFPEQMAEEPSLFGVLTANPNNVQHMFEPGHAGVGGNYKNSVCKIYKVKEGDILPGVQICELGGFREIVPGEM